MPHSPDHLQKSHDAWDHALGMDYEDYLDASCTYIDALEQRLALIEEAVRAEVNDGFGNYMKTIQRALQGKPLKRKQIKK